MKKNKITTTTPDTSLSEDIEFEKALNDFINTCFDSETATDESDTTPDDDTTSEDDDTTDTILDEDDMTDTTPEDDTCPAEKQLEAMVGLKRLKSELREARMLTRFSQIRRNMGLESSTENRHHMLFTGNPGTGKTTVAKLIGDIYSDMGIISIGHTVITDRAKLVGEYIGESEQKVLDAIEQARGGVLFVDEAYTLFVEGNKGNDFGKRVIETLLTVLSDPDPNMIVIFAGYEDKMQELLSFNPGLRDRFPIHLHFDDYDADELMQILKGLCSEHNYTLSDDAESLLKDIISNVLKHRDEHFSNGRWVHNLFNQGLLKAMAKRVMQIYDSSSTSVDDQALFSTITREDVQQTSETYLQLRKQKITPRPRIGFVA